MGTLKNKPEQIELLRRNVGEWNAWRRFGIRPDLSGTDLSKLNLSGANLSESVLSGVNLSEAILLGANLSGANLRWADLSKANLARANLFEANLIGANLFGAKLSNANVSEASLSGATLLGANLVGANLSGTNLMMAKLPGANLNGARLCGTLLSGADLAGANLIGTNLSRATLVETDLREADLTGSRIHGISAWDLSLEGTIQDGLIITKEDQPEITVGDLEVAQFIYLLLFNPKIRKAIDTITSKVVLILGRFSEERKAVLDAMRETLRHRDLVPVIFDFECPTSRDLTETVGTLAHMARFIVADITDPKSIPQELTTIIPDLPSVPIQTVILSSQPEYGMYEHWKRYPWVLPLFRYNNVQHLLASIDESVIRPAEERQRQGL